jgi:tetratricopeptide (TPR) repeat protein
MCEAISAQRSWLEIDLCLQLAQDEAIADGQRALAELVQASVIVQRGSAFQLADEHLRERVYEGMPPARRTALHRRLGALLSAGSAGDLNARLDAGFHLLRGGDERAGAELLADAGTELTHRADELPAAVPALVAALEAFERLGYGPRRTSSLLSALAVAGYRVDRKYAALYGERALAVFEDLTGLSLAARLRPLIGGRLSLLIGLGSGAVRALVHYGIDTPRRFTRLIEDFMTCALSLSGTAALCLHSARVRRYADALSPFAALGKAHAGALAHDFVCTLALTALDRMAEVNKGCERALGVLANPSASVRRVPAESLALLRGGVLYARGMGEVVRGRRAGLAHADEVEAVGLELYAMAADQLRAHYYALRGDSARAAELTGRVELRALQAGTSWQVELWTPAARLHAHVLARDVLGVRGALAELTRLAVDEPGFRAPESFARAAYLSMTGDAEEALEQWRALAAMPARGFMSWPVMMGEYANHAVDMGQHDEARAVIERALGESSPEDHDYITMYLRLFIARARLDAARGDTERAMRQLEELIAQHEADENALILGDLCLARAQIALAAGNREAAQCAADAVERWFRSTGNPALIAQHVQLQRSLEPDSPVSAAAKSPSPLPPTKVSAPPTTSSSSSSSTASSLQPEGEQGEPPLTND